MVINLFMSLLKKLAGETAIYGVSSILSRLLNFVVLAFYLTRVFTKHDYGVVVEMYTYVALAMVLLTYRMETTFFRFGSKSENREQTFSTASIALVIISTIFISVMAFAAQPLANLLRYPDHTDYILWLTFILVFDALSAIPFAKLRLENRPIKFAVLKTVNIIINIFFILFFLEICPYLINNGFEGLKIIFNSDNRIAYIFISNCLASALVFLLMLPEYFNLKGYKEGDFLFFDKVLLKKMIIYASPLVVVGLAGVVNQLISAPMLKELLPGGDLKVNLAKAGEFGAAAKIAVLMNLFIQAFNYAAEPFFFRNAQRTDSKKIYAQVGQAFAMVGAIVFLGIMLYIDLIKYFLGKDFREGLVIVPILLLAYFFLGLYYNFSIWYKLTDKTMIGAWISLAGAVITILANLILIPIYGYVAPAWAALMCYSFMAMSSFFIGKKYYPIDYPIWRIMAYIFSAVGVYGLSTSLAPLFEGAYWMVFLSNTILITGYVLVLYFFEKDQLAKMK